MKNLDAYTDEELREELARVLAHAHGELLNDTEVHRLWQINEEIRQQTPRNGASCYPFGGLSNLSRHESYG
jgi:hypothetical protein